MKIKKPQSNQPMPKNAKCVFRGVLFEVWQWEQKMFNGSVKTFEKLKRPDSVFILPVTQDKKIIILDEKQPRKKPILTLPAGRIEENEPPLKAAQRELLEETGYKAKKWQLFEAFHPVSKIDWAIYVFVAKNCEQIQDPTPDEGEKISIKILNFDKFFDMVVKNKIRATSFSKHFLQAQADKKYMDKIRKMILG